jgi:hypothetical protein
MNPSVDRPVSGVGEDPVLTELVEDLANLLQAGEPVDLEGFLREHPDHAEELRRLLPAVQLMAELGRSAAAGEVSLSSESASANGSALQPEGPLGDFRILREIARSAGAAWAWSTRRFKSPWVAVWP